MSIEHIPAKTQVWCDACGALCGGGFGKGRRIMEGHITVKRHALDYLGQPAADGTVQLDLCDDCLTEICEVINKAAEELKGRKP